MRDILETKIASLEETAGKLKALSEMKQRIAEDVECPPEDPEKFRQKALKDKHEAVAALTAAHTLKVILAARTKREQIALMRHYVLEFGQSASRHAKASNSLADDDPQKGEIDQSGFSDTFVVSILNGILSDIAPEPPHVSPKATAHPSMAGRLGQVLSWTVNLIALAILTIVLVIAAQSDGTSSAGAVLVGGVIAAVIWMVGRALRYVLAGS
jgi:hypothetical protein